MKIEKSRGTYSDFLEQSNESRRLGSGADLANFIREKGTILFSLCREPLYIDESNESNQSPTLR